MSKPGIPLLLNLVVLIGFGHAVISATAADEKNATTPVRILQIQGTVQLMTAGARKRVLTQTNQDLSAGDRLRTGNNSRVTLRGSDESVVSFVKREQEIAVLRGWGKEIGYTKKVFPANLD